MAREKIDWTLHGDLILSLYAGGLSVREVVERLANETGVVYKSGTLTNYIGRAGLLRSKIEAHKLALDKAKRICELCQREHKPNNWNQRWCNDCTGMNKHKRRVRNHGLPSSLFDEMFERQARACKICHRQFDTCLNTRTTKTLYVDHDHETNQVRGLLCPRCNNGMSYVDDVDWLTKAIKYVSDCKEEQDKVYVRPPRMRRYVRNKPTNVTTK